MNIDISKIVNDKIKSLEESGKIKEKIEEGIEKTILNSIDSALNSYSLERDIEDKVSQNVSNVASKVGFSAYNGFISSKIKDITEGKMRDDVAKKIQKTFDDMLILKHDGIKLSEICEKYREWILENTDYEEKWERKEFLCKVNKEKNGSLYHYDVKFNEEAISDYEDADIEFSFCTYGEEEKNIFQD